LPLKSHQKAVAGLRRVKRAASCSTGKGIVQRLVRLIDGKEMLTQAPAAPELMERFET